MNVRLWVYGIVLAVWVWVWVCSLVCVCVRTRTLRVGAQSTVGFVSLRGCDDARNIGVPAQLPNDVHRTSISKDSSTVGSVPGSAAVVWT